MVTPARERLLDAAGPLFYLHGITSTGIESVVQAAGVTKPTLYANFPRKVDLVAAVLRRRHEPIWRRGWAASRCSSARSVSSSGSTAGTPATASGAVDS